MPDPVIPPSIDRVLKQFQRMSREDKMQTLVAYSRKLEPLPERLAALDRAEFTVPECNTRVDVFPEYRDGRMHFYADLDAKRSPTIAAFLALLFGAVNEQPPSTTLAIPTDFVRIVMEGMGLAAREVGLNALLGRIKRYAAQAEAQAA
jgi:cysteine desulfuration protein SufE